MREGITYLESLPLWDPSRSFGLEAIQPLLAELGNPQDIPKSVHIAGTNGKGSVAAGVSAALGSSGCSVGMLHSPPLGPSHCERFLVDGLPVTEEALDQAAQTVRHAADKLNLNLSQHEADTACGFMLFKGLNWIVVEVGLGGTHDASNVLSRPEVTAIVSIGEDHQGLLGDSLEEITSAKAGITKNGVPMVVGPVPDEAFSVISRAAREQGAPVIKVTGSNPNEYPNIEVVKAISAQIGLSPEAVDDGLCNVRWPGRQEIVTCNGRTVILDCAHNVPAVNRLAAFLEAKGFRDLTLAFGVLQDKNWREMIRMLQPYVVNWDIVEPISDRAVAGDEIVSYLKSLGLSATNSRRGYQSVLDKHCLSSILVVGSTYLIGPFRELVVSETEPVWKRCHG